MTYNSIRPGQIWLDNNEKRIQAHGGSIMVIGDTFYWYGENKEKSTPGNGIWHWGVKCYTSKDLYNWEDKGIIIPPDMDNLNSPLHPTSSMDRPHIIYNGYTKKFVCWLKIIEKKMQTETVLTADEILGPYTIVKQGFRPLGMSAGDFDLVVDPSDDKAYYYFERVHSELICADLTDDYTNVTGYYSTHFPRLYPPFVREAPAYFYRKGMHYMFTSGTTGYHPNLSEVASAKSYHGPWDVLGNPHLDDKSCTSFNSQITSVFKHPSRKDLYIALADRWMPELPANTGCEFETGKQYEKVAKWFEKSFNKESQQLPKQDEVYMYYNTSIADYVWLPIRFDGYKPYIAWEDEWRICDHE